jgi:hypothetical protein
MLRASRARLERLEVEVSPDLECLGDGLVHLAQALRCCSPTLKGFVLGSNNTRVGIHERAQDYATRVERLRVQWAEALAGMSACRELQVLVLPYIDVEPLFPPGAAFHRLTHLEISAYKREHPPDAGMMGLWELMASGGLPALAKLKVWLEGLGGGVNEVRSRVAPGLEAVAGSLTHLHLAGGGLDEVRMGYELGVAVGKLRRLKDLALHLSRDGRFYHAFAQGLAAGGGDRPLPLLWRVRIYSSSSIRANADLLASLLLPSVRVFGPRHSRGRGTLLIACALRRVGYKHTLMVDEKTEEVENIVRAIASCSVCDETVSW